MDIWAIFAIRKELKKGDSLNSKSIAITAFIIWLVITVIFATTLLWILEL